LNKKCPHTTVNDSLLDYEDISGIVCSIYTMVPDHFNIFFNGLGKGISNKCTVFFFLIVGCTFQSLHLLSVGDCSLTPPF